MPTSKSTTLTLTLWKRAALWITAAIAIAAYWDPKALNGPFIYDDVASVINNEVVMLKVPWQEAFRRDFWGTPMKEPQSHKSYRPITSLTLRWNMLWSYIIQTAGKDDHTYYFHVVNVLLHGVNTGLVTETAAIVLGDDSIAAPIIAGIVFGIHPVHAEAVSNITSRGELLMTLFFLLAFLSYANHIPAPETSATTEGIEDEKSPDNKHKKKNRATSPKGGKKVSIQKSSDLQTTKRLKFESLATRVICVYVLPCLFMALSLFSKEQGVTTLCTLVAFDFIRHHSSLKSFLAKVQQGDTYSWAFLKRTGVLAVQTLLLAGLRYYLNGESKPEFVEEQNPAGFAKDRFVRVMSVNWIYCLYIRDMVFPVYLAPDWSGIGIPLIKSMSDDRVWIVGLLWLSVFGCVYSLCAGPSPKASKLRKDVRQVILISFFAFLFLPFLLSSNLLVTTGLTKGDRVIYLPLFGYCLLQGLLYKVISGYQGSGEGVALMGMYAFFTIQFSFFGLKTHERNLAWADEYTLWTRAVKVNPRSHHTRSNAGRMLAKNTEYVKAEEILRPIGDVKKNGGNPNDTFLYAVALSKLDRCEEAFRLIDDATEYIFEEREEGGIRYDPKMSFHAQSSLVVARAFCTHEVIEKGQLMQQALVVDPTNDFARSQFLNYVDTLQRMYMQMKQMGGQEHPQRKLDMAAAERQLRAMEQQMLQIQQQQGMPQPSPEEIQKLRQMKMQEMMQMQKQQQGMPQNQEQLQAMQRVMEMQQQQGIPQNQEQMQAMQRMLQMQQQQMSVKQQQQQRPTMTPKMEGTKDVPQNLGLPPTPKQGIPPNLGMPPIEEFESGKYDDMFFN